ncbi:MAG TPA: DUF4097 family beta strand repeat-containing protein [Gaiellales bacterium]|nr:DUF4097 family beta strand repeat-containing protein [Gaiellales bacterium]
MTDHHTPGTVVLDLRVGAGEVDVTTADTDTTSVELESLSGESGEIAIAATEQDCRPGPDGAATVRVHVPRGGARRWFSRDPEVRVRVTAPHGARLRCDTASADVAAGGRLGALDLRTASGDVTAEAIAGDARVKTMSGDVRLGDVGGSADLHTMSGDQTVASIADGATLRSMSGDVVVGSAAGSCDISTMSGDVRLDAVARGAVAVATASGDVTLGVVRGTRVWMDVQSVAGEADSDLDHADPGGSGDAQLRLRVASSSGDVRVRRGAQTAAH